MKTLKITSMLVLMTLIAFTSCKKEPGFEGKNNIKGTITLNGKPISKAIVYLAFDAKEATTNYNASTVTDAEGKYSFSAVSPGDYFVDAEYTNPMQIKFESAGAKVKIEAKKDVITVDLTVQ